MTHRTRFFAHRPRRWAALLTAPALATVGALAAAQDAPPDGVTDPARLAELAREIEPEVAKLRGLEFVRPVAVELAQEDTLRDYALQRMDMMQPREVRLAQESMLELLGLIPADMDYEAELIELLQSQVAGFYDPAGDIFYLVHGLGEAMARATMAHELIHALDDQHVDLDERLMGLLEDSDRAAAFHAVMEGGATELANQWTMANMSPTEMMRMMRQSTEMSAGLTEAPEMLWRPLLHSYIQGGAFLKRSQSALAAGMKTVELADVMRAFREPPQSTEQVLHPEKYWDPAKLDLPTRVRHGAVAGSGWNLLHSDTFGELSLAILVDPKRGTRTGKNPMSVAFEPFGNAGAAGWDGDRMSLFANGSRRYLRVDSVWDDADEANEFARALGAIRPRIDAAVAAVEARDRAEGAAPREARTALTVDGATVAFEIWIGARPEPESVFTLSVEGPIEEALVDPQREG